MDTEEKFKKALKYAENSIKMNYGSLKDLPPELANTVCNIYFKYCFSSITDPVSMMASDVKNDLKRISEHIENLRTINKKKKPNEYNYLVQYILDCLKYRIDNAHLKSGFKRFLERKIKKKKVEEIPNLTDLMDVY